MKNLILRANILDENVNIEHKVLSLPLSNNMVEVMISPKVGYVLEPENLSHGALPLQISSIDFIKSGPNVIARVLISSNINNNISQNISLPLISQSTLNIDSFSLLDVNINDTSKVSVVSTSPYFRSIKTDGESYSITSAPGEAQLVLSKTITAINGYYFSSGPNYKITGNSNRYSVREDVVRDSMKRITSKKLNIYYTSPIDLDSTNNEDRIEFNFLTSTKTYGRKKSDATKKEEYEVYSFDEGRKIGAEGGTKIMRVRGVPGTEFKIIVQDNDKKTYNFTTGKFEAGGGMFVGTIPRTRGSSYGTTGYSEAVVSVVIPKSTTAKTYKTIFTTDKPIDHEALTASAKGQRASVEDENIKDIAIQSVINPPKEVVVDTYSVMNWEIGNGGSWTIEDLAWEPLPYTSVTESQMNDKIFTGKGKVGTSTGDIIFKCIVYPPSDKVVRIVTQPLTDKPGTYVNQDQTAHDAIASRANAAGTTITNDWSMTDSEVASGVDFRAKTTAVGYGEPNSDATSDGDVYPAVLLSGVITGIKFGKSDVTAKLDLLNFLKQYTL